jgi:hypothetical protein
MWGDNCWVGVGVGLGAGHERRVSVQAAWCGVGACGAGASSAAPRCGLVPVPPVLAGVGGGGGCVGASCRGACAPAAVGCAGRALGRVGVSRRARRALLPLSPRSPATGRRDRSGVRAAVIAITGGSHTSAVRHYSLTALIAVECGVFALGGALIGISMRGSFGAAARGLLLGVARGCCSGCPTSP